jgi:hypothetical protein
MNDRPLNERPAARPKRDLTPQPEPVDTRPWYAKLGCFGTIVVISVGITLGAYGIGSIALLLNGPSSGREVYDVEPLVEDPRATFPISAECDAAMAASAADSSEEGERLLKETGNICVTREEWEAALYKYPGAIGGTSTAYLDGSEFDLLCGSYPKVKLCRNQN